MGALTIKNYDLIKKNSNSPLVLIKRETGTFETWKGPIWEACIWVDKPGVPEIARSCCKPWVPRIFEVPIAKNKKM